MDDNVLRSIVSRVILGEPVQYLLGEAWFCGRKFKVGPGVLIPRPETELILEIVRSLPTKPGAVVWDLATGSGILAICLALEGKDVQVTATDISTEALRIAADNAMRLGADVKFIAHDLLSGIAPVQQDPDLIVSNPPYITESERSEMENHVLRYEPSQALFVPSDDPLVFYRVIAALARRALVPGGRIVVEINQRYGHDVIALFQQVGLIDVHLERDVSGHHRCVRAVQPAVL